MIRDAAFARSLGPNQQLLHQRLIPSTGDTFWVQATTGTTPLRDTRVTLNDTAPTSDRWNFSAVEVLAAGAPPPPPDTTPPIVQITVPTAGQTVSGSVTVTANATDNVALNAVNPVLFFLNGTTNQLPGPVTSNGSQYSTAWDTTRTANGIYSLSAIVTDSSNNISKSTVSGLIVSNPPPMASCFVVDAAVDAHGRGPVTTPTNAFTSALPGELLVAFAASDGPNDSAQTLSVSGAGLSWRLVRRSNAQSGTAEIWTATAPTALTNVKFTATQARTGYDMSLYVIAVQGISKPQPVGTFFLIVSNPPPTAK